MYIYVNQPPAIPFPTTPSSIATMEQFPTYQYPQKVAHILFEQGIQNHVIIDQGIHKYIHSNELISNNS